MRCNYNRRIFIETSTAGALGMGVSSTSLLQSDYGRYSSELSRSGYIVNKSTSGVRCFGNGEGSGYHPG